MSNVASASEAVRLSCITESVPVRRLNAMGSVQPPGSRASIAPPRCDSSRRGWRAVDQLPGGQLGCPAATTGVLQFHQLWNLVQAEAEPPLRRRQQSLALRIANCFYIGPGRLGECADGQALGGAHVT